MGYAEVRPDNVKKRFPDSKVPLLNGKALVKTAKKFGAMIMATNCRCRLPIEGIARASMATGAPVMYEIAKSELGYTEFTPKLFVDAVMEVNERLGNIAVPFSVHADHLGVKSPDAVSEVAALIHEQLEAGFTSFAVDASHMVNEDNLKATIELGKIVQDKGLCLEVELGEIGAKKGTTEGFTQPEEAAWFIGELDKAGIHPDLLAINNGSIHGTYFGEAHEGIQLDLTRRIYEAIQKWDVDIAQHGITGTSLEKIREFIKYGIRKGNVGTFWQNVCFGTAMDSNGNAITRPDKSYVYRPYRGVPSALWEEMWKWAQETGNIGGNIKKANKVFADKFNNLEEPYRNRITIQAYEEAIRLFEATNSFGLADKVMEFYG
ncbi:MAG: class II fructose-bisphosphate aldolase [Deltaproteobacteria bacterium]|nr:class II fructose-bisphosphate aldolase [Deltaproteobacteria bacterium]